MVRRKTNAEFLAQVHKLPNGDEYTFLEEYRSAHEKIEVRHNICGRVYKIDPHSFIKGVCCNACVSAKEGARRKTSDEQFRSEMYEKFGDEYTFLESYKGLFTNIACIHNLCGFVWSVRPANIRQGSGCPKCGRRSAREKQSLGDAEFTQRVIDTFGDEYVFIEAYKNMNTKIMCTHTKCNRSFAVAPKEFLAKRSGCPSCAMYRGEAEIARVLNELKIHALTQVRFANLKHKGLLKFDFYLPDYDVCIEYDGAFHYTPIWSSTEAEFKEAKARDKLKDKYCAENGIELIRIPYWDFDNIREIITGELGLPQEHTNQKVGR